MGDKGGKKDKAKTAKTNTTRELWVPAVNNYGGFGRWGYVEVKHPDEAREQVGLAIENLYRGGTVTGRGHRRPNSSRPAAA